MENKKEKILGYLKIKNQIQKIECENVRLNDRMIEWENERMIGW